MRPNTTSSDSTETKTMNLTKSDLELHPDTNDTSLDEVFYIIVECNDGLHVACAQGFDMYDYTNIVSRMGFNNEQDAIKYGRELAKKNGKNFAGGSGLLD